MHNLFFLGVIINQHLHYLDSNFELDVQSWFRTAKTRFDGEKNLKTKHFFSSNY